MEMCFWVRERESSYHHACARMGHQEQSISATEPLYLFRGSCLRSLARPRKTMCSSPISRQISSRKSSLHKSIFEVGNHDDLGCTRMLRRGLIHAVFMLPFVKNFNLDRQMDRSSIPTQYPKVKSRIARMNLRNRGSMQPRPFIAAFWLACIIVFTCTEILSSKNFLNPFSSQKKIPQAKCISQHHSLPLPAGKLGRHANRILLKLRGGCNEADKDDFRDEKDHGGIGSDSENWDDDSGLNHTGADNASHVKLSTAREGLVDFHYRKGEVFYNKVRSEFSETCVCVEHHHGHVLSANEGCLDGVIFHVLEPRPR
jgi:hypothetical protein